MPKNYGLADDIELAEIPAPELPYRPRPPRSYSPPIGLIGCGGISQAHLRAYQAAGYRVVALCDCDAARAESRRAEFYPDAKVYTDPAELLRRDDLEVIDIATHPREREHLIPLALDARKHVLSQKPFVLDLDVGQRLCDLADARGVRLAVNQNARWSPHVAYARLAIEGGLVGSVLGAHLHCHWNHDWIAGLPFDGIHHIILYDYAIHWFDAVHCFMRGRQAERVTASVRRAQGQSARPPLLAQVMIDYADAQATLVFDGFTPVGMHDAIFIAATDGAIDIRGREINAHTVTLYNRDGYATPDLEGSWFREGFLGTMSELLCAIDENRRPYNDARDTLDGLAMCFAAVASADTGQPQVPGAVRRLPER
ncbi:MAG TPA: Gfo/Idh/MocA family oxidoreductase [Tepidisphaeraceae bacterium]|nr:Gfo/Idh/MocA family oxidoreductase [Tepidisphaeraceae bacterium]